MLNEEIIRRLEFAKLRIDDITYSPETIEALDIAIEIFKERDEERKEN